MNKTHSISTTALITGATSGIGYELALLSAAHGFDLILVARNQTELEKVSQELEQQFNITVKIFACDLSNASQLEKLITKLSHLQIDVLINNAGFGSNGPFIESDWHHEAAMMSLNMAAVTRLIRALVPGMVTRKNGMILNLGSVASFFPGPYMTTYFATKAFILSFSQALAEELVNTGVTVTTLCPGPLNTGFAKAAGMADSKTFNESTTSVRAVAKAGFQGMLHGERVVIPSWQHRILISLTRLLPLSVVTRLVARNQK